MTWPSRGERPSGPAEVGRDRQIAAAIQGPDRALGVRTDVEIEDLRRQPQGGAGVRNIDDATDMTLHRRTPEKRIRLRAGIAELLQIFNRVQASLPIRDLHVE